MPPLLFFDTETTGFKSPQMIECAYAHAPLNCGVLPEEIDIYGFRCRPSIRIEEGAVAVHGITDAMLEVELPFKDKEDYELMQKLFAESCAVAHNAPFDVGVMRREGIDVPLIIDTQKIARAIYPKAPNHKLQGLREHLRIPVLGKAHTAGGDVAVLIALFRKMQLDLTRIWKETPEAALERMARLSV